MRLVVALLVTVGTGAWAQWSGGGVWTGYVNGWVPNQPRVAPIPYALPYYGYVAPYSWWDSGSAPSSAWSTAVWQQQAAADQAVERARLEREAQAARRAAEEAAAREYAARQAEQELAAQKLALQQEAQQLLARQLEQEKAARELAEREAARRAAAAGPPVKGPEVYRWVDDEGVVHYSTRAPATVKAEKVGK